MKQIQVKNLKDVIRQCVGEDFVVLEESSRTLTSPGEHYGSIMLAISLKIKLISNPKPKILNLVAKMIPASDMLREAFDIYVTFKKEVHAYTRAIPALINLQKEYNVKNEKILDIFPKCYGARLSLNPEKDEVDEDAVLIFENLKILGFNTGDRFTGFDLVTTKLIVRDLAKLHALPIALRKLKPDTFEKEFMPCLVQSKGLDKLPEDVMDAFTDSIVDVGKQFQELKPYMQRVEQLVQQAWENLKKPAPAPKETFATFCHCDYWVNNTMVLWDENGNPIKNKMVDLQIIQYDSGVKDLIFLLFSSVSSEIRENYWDELLDIYYDTFIEYLKDFDLDLDPYSRKAFLQEVDDCGPKEFFHIAFMLKPIFTEKGKVKSLDEFTPSDWSRRDLIGPRHAQKMKEFLLGFVKRNWL